MRLSPKASTSLFVVIFVVAFFLRAYQPLSWPPQWLQRSNAFTAALAEHDWAGTYQKIHPGVTTMAISGASVRLYDAISGTPTEVLMSWTFPSYATGYGKRMAAGVTGLALVIAGLIVATTLALRKLGGWPLALGAAGLMTFSPFYLSQGRVLHLDALVSSLMLLSGLLLLLSLESGQRRYLVLSGLVGGLALLTKSPSLFLVPFTGLALLAYLVKRLRAGWEEHTEGRERWLAQETWHGLVGPMLLWLLLASLLFALWPAVWVQPLHILDRMFSRISRHIEKGHSMRFFAGRIGSDHPPVLFYPVMIAFNSSFLTLTLALAALGQYTLWRRRAKLPATPLAFWLLVAYVVFFTLQMTIGAHQTSRYILPASLALEILAAVGLGGVIELGYRALAGRESRLVPALPAALVALAVGLQALTALPYAPDYGAHHNHLLGGNRVAVKMVEIGDQNEGIIYVADYLNRLPGAESLQVGVSTFVDYSLKQYFPGEIARHMSAEDDYHLFSIGPLQRQLNLEQWYYAWEAYGGAPPQVLVILDGVEYMWLYATQPPIPYHPVVIRRGGGIGFIVLAWVWTAGLAAMVVWALRHVERPGPKPAEPGQTSGSRAGDTSSDELSRREPTCVQAS